MKIHDPARGKYVAAGPEELVRQELVRILVSGYGVPLHLVETEFPLSRIEPGNRDRVDILVHEFRSGSGARFPWLLVECKRSWEEPAELQAQLGRYLRVLTPRYLMLDQGGERWILSRNSDGSYSRTDTLPQYPAIPQE